MRVTLNAGISSEGVADSTPFPHAVLPGILPENVANEAAKWLATEAAWRLETSSFYKQFGCRNVDALAQRMPADLCDALAARLGELFSASLSSERARLTAHRLVPGQGIGIHNDDPSSGSETHRLVITFTLDHADHHGGHLVLFHQRDPTAVARVIRPLSGVGVAFPLSSRSWHAVAEVTRGSRYSLIFSFWEAGAPYELTDAVHGVRPQTGVGARRTPSISVPEHWQPIVALLDRLGAKTVPHSGTTLYDHLIRTGLILENWGCPRATCAAGMAHSVYGTSSFHDPLLARNERRVLAGVLGDEAEALVFRFSTDQTADDDQLRVIQRANHLEQERAR